MDYKKYIAERINIDGVGSDEIYSLIVTPPNSEMGDFALPCFKFSKILRKSPAIIAEELKAKYVTDDIISEVAAVNGYLNFGVNKAGLAKSILSEILGKGKNYGKSEVGSGKTAAIVRGKGGIRERGRRFRLRMRLRIYAARKRIKFK